MRLLAEAAPLDFALDAWIRATARVLRDVVAGLVDVPAYRAGAVLRSAAGQDQVVAGDVLEPVGELIRRSLVPRLRA